MGTAKNHKKSKAAKPSQPSPEKPLKIGGTPKKDTSKLYAQMALAPENKKQFYQRLIDFLEK